MPEADIYTLLKALHIFGVVIFLGNIIVTGFWKAFADFTKQWEIIAFSQRLVTYTDLIFTSLGAFIVAVTGVMMARYYHDYLQIKWIAWGLCLFIASGLIWLLILVPIQIKLHIMVNKWDQTKRIPAKYWFYEKIWFALGFIATLLPFMNIYWMVYKPL